MISSRRGGRREGGRGSSALIKRGVAKQPRILSGDKLKWPNRGFKEGGRKRTDGRKAATTEFFGLLYPAWVRANQNVSLHCTDS